MRFKGWGEDGAIKLVIYKKTHQRAHPLTPNLPLSHVSSHMCEPEKSALTRNQTLPESTLCLILPFAMA